MGRRVEAGSEAVAATGRTARGGRATTEAGKSRSTRTMMTVSFHKEGGGGG